jgi:hypothetical protein
MKGKQEEGRSTFTILVDDTTSTNGFLKALSS